MEDRFSDDSGKHYHTLLKESLSALSSMLKSRAKKLDGKILYSTLFSKSLFFSFFFSFFQVYCNVLLTFLAEEKSVQTLQSCIYDSNKIIGYIFKN